MQWLLWMARSLRFWSSFNGLVKLICNRSRSFTGLFGEAQWYQFPNFQLEGLHRFPLVSTGFRQGSHRSSIPGAGTAARCTVEDSSSYHIYKSLLSIYHINLSNLSIYVWLWVPNQLSNHRVLDLPLPVEVTGSTCGWRHLQRSLKRWNDSSCCMSRCDRAITPRNSLFWWETRFVRCKSSHQVVVKAEKGTISLTLPKVLKFRRWFSWVDIPMSKNP